MSYKILHHLIYKNSQAKEWLVFLHGAGGSTATWKLQLEKFTASFNILLIDLRDHGQSKSMEPAVDQYKFDLITEDILQVLKFNQIQEAHFITLSFGSVLLQDLSIKYPKMVLTAIFAGGIFKANWAIRSFVHVARFINLFFPYKWMYSIFSYLLMPFKRHQKSRKIYKQQAKKLLPSEYMKWVGLYKEFFALLERFYHQPIHFPSLVIMGREDYIFNRAAKSFSKQHAAVQLAIIRNAGHICNIDQPQIFNDLAYDFIVHRLDKSFDLPTDQAQKIKIG